MEYVKLADANCVPHPFGKRSMTAVLFFSLHYIMSEEFFHDQTPRLGPSQKLVTIGLCVIWHVQAQAQAQAQASKLKLKHQQYWQ